MTPPSGSHAHGECAGLFASEMSMFGIGFEQLEPEPYKALCLQTAAQPDADFEKVNKPFLNRSNSMIFDL